jgi:hypothetical protein
MRIAGLVSAAAGVGASLATPTGLTALGVALGITSAPLIVTAAPIIALAATVTGAVSGGRLFLCQMEKSALMPNLADSRRCSLTRYVTAKNTIFFKRFLSVFYDEWL